MKTESMHIAPTWPLDEDSPLMVYLKTVLAQHPCGLCTDIDGTISLTAPTVDQAVLLPGMKELLTDATNTFDLVATISGRAIADQQRMIGIPNVWHVGHHGYEWQEENPETGERQDMLYPGVEPYLAEVATALDEIEAELKPQIPGLWMERKGITGGVHWRLAEDKEQAEAIAAPVIKRIATLHGLRWRGGKLAIELYPPIVTHKGEGLRRLVEKHHLKSVLYFGDDISDVDAFQVIRHMREQGICEGLAIAIKQSNSPLELTHYADILCAGPLEAQIVIAYLTRN